MFDDVTGIGVTTPTGGNVAAVVGGVVGGLLVVALSVLVLILLLVIKRRKGKSLIENRMRFVAFVINFFDQ